MRLCHFAVGVMLLASAGCGGKKADCQAVAKVLKDSGQKLAEGAKGKGDADPSLAKMLEDYASDLKAVKVSDADVSKHRDAYAAGLTKQATATKSWQTANTANDAAGKAAATAQITAARTDQDKAGKELIAYCAK